MSIINLHNNALNYSANQKLKNLLTEDLSTNYKDARDNYFKYHENSYLAQGNPLVGPINYGKIHDDSVGIPTIGYGYNLSARSSTEITAYLTHVYYSLILPKTVAIFKNVNARLHFTLTVSRKEKAIV